MVVRPVNGVSKSTVAICVTVILCMAIGVAGFLTVHGSFSGSQFFSLITWAGVGIGIIGNLARTEQVAQATEAVAQTALTVEKQTNGTNTRLQRVADLALAALPPDRAAEILSAVDTADHGAPTDGPDDGGYYPTGKHR